MFLLNRFYSFLKYSYLIPYVFLAIFISNQYDYEIYNLTSDLEFYHSYAFGLFQKIGIEPSELSLNICREWCERTLEEWEWIPSPLYSTLFFLPITLLGSKFIFSLQGIFIGCTNFVLMNKLAQKYLFSAEDKYSLLIWSFLLVINPTIVLNTIGSSPMSVFLMFVLIGLAFQSLPIRYFFFGLAIVIRISSICFLVPYILVLIILKPDKFIKNIFFSIGLFVIYLISYKYFFSTSPISFPSSLFVAEGTYYSDWTEYVKGFLSKSFGVDSLYQKEKMVPLFDLFHSLFAFKFEGINILIQNYMIKLSILIGFQYDGLTMGGDFGLYGPVRILKTILLGSLTLPGFYNILSTLIRPKDSVKSSVKLIFLLSLITLLLSSTLITNSRYAIPIIPILIYSGMDFWCFNKLSSCRSYST